MRLCLLRAAAAAAEMYTQRTHTAYVVQTTESAYNSHSIIIVRQSFMWHWWARIYGRQWRRPNITQKRLARFRAAAEQVLLLLRRGFALHDDDDCGKVMMGCSYLALIHSNKGIASHAMQLSNMRVHELRIVCASI